VAFDSFDLKIIYRADIELPDEVFPHSPTLMSGFFVGEC